MKNRIFTLLMACLSTIIAAHAATQHTAVSHDGYTINRDIYLRVTADKVYEQGTDLRPSSAVQDNHTEKRLSNGHILLYRNGIYYTLLGTRYL
ncbi:MAG: hypothetical protein ACI3Z8_04015 [Paludibacteraceae bacterium]